MKYVDRFYRSFELKGTTPFQIAIGESDLFIRADGDFSDIAKERLGTVRMQIEQYIKQHPEFADALSPLPIDAMAPQVVRSMLEAGQKANVGPMAAVAGAVANMVGQELTKVSKQVMVENGGDLYLKLNQDLVVGIFAGKSVLSGKVGLKIQAGQTPCGLCTSSGTVGHSLSHGQADAVTIYSNDPALADATATAIGNLVHKEKDIEPALHTAMNIDGIKGVCIIYKDKLGALGEIELCPID